MPETPIDQSSGIQSIRLKVPTGTVPIPPAGFGQLHSPSPGTLALRLPDGSVVPIGGGGGSATTLENERGLVTVEQVGAEPQAVTIYPKPESNGQIKLAGSVIDQQNQPQAPDAVTLVQRADPPTTPPPGTFVLYTLTTGGLRATNPDGSNDLAVYGGGSAVASVGADEVFLADGLGSSLDINGGAFYADGHTVDIWSDGPITITAGSGGSVKLAGLPAADPAVANALWVDPVTRNLKVSAG